MMETSLINIAIKQGYSDSETKTINLFKLKSNKVNVKYFQKAKDVPEDFVPLGGITWVTDVLGFVPVPNHYPDFLSHLITRKLWKANKWPMEKNIFIKPFDKPKRFQARVTYGNYRGKKKPPFWCSELVCFTNEWRYYIANEEVLYVGWYDGIDCEAIAPKFEDLNITLPKGWCGAIDIGYLQDGTIELVECGEPYSIGWYGDMMDGDIYLKFIVEGWKWMKNNLKEMKYNERYKIHLWLVWNSL